MNFSSSKIGHMLEELGYITPTQLERCVNKQKKSGHLMSYVLVSEDIIEPGTIVAFLSLKHGYDISHVTPEEIDSTVVSLIPVEAAYQYQAMPLHLDGDLLRISMTDPTDEFAPCWVGPS